MPPNWIIKATFLQTVNTRLMEKARKIYGSLSRRKTLLSGKNIKPSETEEILVKNLIWTHEKNNKVS